MLSFASMGELAAALKYSGRALEFLAQPKMLPLAAVFFASLLMSGQAQRPWDGGRWKPAYWWVAAHLLFFPAAIAVALVWGAPAGVAHQISIPGEVTLNALTVASLVAGLYWVWLLEGLRWFALSLVALMELLVWSALFVAGMAISGSWA